jgi:hypothetical protein
VNTRDKNFTPGAVRRRLEQAEASIARYLQALDTADRQEGEEAVFRGDRIKARLAALRKQVRDLRVMEAELAAAPDGQISLTDPSHSWSPVSGRSPNVLCGWLPRCKARFDVLAGGSGAVLCPAC